MSKKAKSFVISYLTVRKAIGILGIIFPVILVVGSVVAGGCQDTQSSISAYYHTNMRNIFVGTLCIVSLFLFSYKGYSELDNTIANLAGIFGIMVALFPTSITDTPPPCMIFPITSPHIIGTIHLISAGLFFLMLAYFSLFLFTKSDGKHTKQKRHRNVVYRICGCVMLACVVILIPILTIPSLKAALSGLKPVFCLETIALWAFGVSWLIKGEFLMKDKQPI